MHILTRPNPMGFTGIWGSLRHAGSTRTCITFIPYETRTPGLHGDTYLTYYQRSLHIPLDRSRVGVPIPMILTEDHAATRRYILAGDARVLRRCLNGSLFTPFS